MMGKRKPALRFKGFEGEWETCRLGDIVQIIMGQSPDGSTYSETPSDYILVQGNADLKNGWVTPRIWTTRATKKASAGDLIMSVRAPAGTMGKTAYNVVLGRGVAAIKGNEFLYQNLVKMDSDGYWRKLSSGSTFESLNSNDIKNAELFVSSNTEQIRIGDFFQQLDALITQQQRKYDSLLNVKKSMLEKMFPKNGADVPEIRFKGFCGAWKQCKLDELMTISSAARVHKNEWVEFGVPFFRSSDVVSNYKGEDNKKAYISYTLFEELAQRSGKLQKDDILITGGGSIGVPYLVMNDNPLYFKDGDLVWLKNAGCVEGYFLYSFFSTSFFRTYIGQISHVGTIAHYTIEQAQKTPILLPSIEEQTKIGNYFKHLDTHISLHRQKLDHLNHIKSALLEKMFVSEAA